VYLIATSLAFLLIIFPFESFFKLKIHLDAVIFPSLGTSYYLIDS